MNIPPAALAGSSLRCAFTFEGVDGDVAIVALRGEHDEILVRFSVNAADTRRLAMFFGLIEDEIGKPATPTPATARDAVVAIVGAPMGQPLGVGTAVEGT